MVALIKGQAANLVDTALDLTVVPGFSAIGYRARKRIFGWQADRLEGRSVMVTGANAGIGRAISLELSRRGATVHMVCRNPESIASQHGHALLKNFLDVMKVPA